MDNRRTVLLIIAAIVLATWPLQAEQVWPKTVPAAQAVGVDEFSFAVLGDNRPSGADQPQPEVYRQILGQINETDAVLVINTGDVILGSTDMALMNRELDDFIATTEPLTAPMYVAYGNHELRNAEALAVLQQRIGPSYYAFNYGNSRFYVLNTYVPGEGGRITGEQLTWLRQDLAAEGTAMAHRFVFFHAPMFSPMNDIGRRS